MGEVTPRIFCYIPHILGCKIFGGIQAVLNAVYLALDIHSLVMIVNERFSRSNDYFGYFDSYLAGVSVASLALTIAIMIDSLAILISLVLIAGVMKRKSCLVKTWMLFNVLAILAYAYQSFFTGDWKNLGSLAVALWSELIAYGALKEIKILNASNLPDTVQAQSLVVSLPQPQSGAPPNPQPQSGLPTYAEAEAQSQLPYPMTEIGAPPLPTLQQPAGHI